MSANTEFIMAFHIPEIVLRMQKNVMFWKQDLKSWEKTLHQRMNILPLKEKKKKICLQPWEMKRSFFCLMLSDTYSLVHCH